MKKRAFLQDDEPSEESLVNLTPLIDVVFVVLISFMLISPMLNVDIVELANSSVEKTKDSLPSEQSPLSITVRADNSIWLQGRRVTLETLRETFLKQKKLHPESVPQLFHDRHASFGTYQSVKNTLEDCGFQRMDVLLKPS